MPPLESQRSKSELVGEYVASLVHDKSFYDQSYLCSGRMFSFAHQVEAVFPLKPRRVLEVGPGPGIVTHALRTGGIEVLTLDVEASVNPDVLGSVTDIPLKDDAVDVVLCCQVLEHLPFDRFIPALRELRRVASTGGVVSLPDITPAYFVRANLPVLHRREFAISRTRRNPPASVPGDRHKHDGHFWEIGVNGTQPKQVRTAIRESGWRIAREERVERLTWHHFFILDAR